jgi:hypothetical protein
MKAQVPAANLPTRMAVDNRLTSIYSTHVLIPKLGPIATQRYTKLYARLLKDLAAALELIHAAQAYAKTYRKPVAIPAPPAKSSQRDFRFRPLLGGGNDYQTFYIAGLLPFASPRPGNAYRLAKTMTNGTEQRSFAASKPAKAVAKTAAPSTADASGELQFKATHAWPTEVTQLMRNDPVFEVADGRMIINSITPDQYLTSGTIRQSVMQWAKTGKGIVDADSMQREVVSATTGASLAQILHGIAQPNAVIEDLLAAGALNASGRWLGKELAKAEDVPETVATLLGKYVGTISKDRRDGLDPLLEQALALLLKLGANGASLLDRLRKDAHLRARLFAYLIGRIDRLGGIDVGPTPLPDDTVIVGSREWAFRRTERLSIAVGTPTLRGPFATEAVAPASKLVLSESNVQEVVSFSTQGSTHSRTQASESANFSAATFRQALAHMSEEGINSEGAFSQETTLFDSLRERRREAIERTLTQVSSSNEQRSGTVTRSVTSQSRSYTTRGKDAVHATTEVSFQVAAPVDVEVRLEDVGLVWCPRLPSPFIALHRLITEHEQESRADYIAQNFVSDPARPPEYYETTTFRHEIGIDGNRSPQVISFNIPIPSQFMDWTLDDDACIADYRNGTSADYQEYDRWNWDDLENWNVRFVSIQRIAGVVTGSAVFSTTDTEILNRGFITIDIVMKRLTEDSRAAIAAFDLDHQEAAAQRRAVEVRAKQYARLRRDELIEQYEGSLELREEAFSGLVRTVFQGGYASHLSYWREILRSCIDWSAAGMRFEPADMNAMAYTHLPPSHFMNAQGIRFILPIHRSAEDAFFEALKGGAGTYFQKAAAKVCAYVDGYRKIVEEAKASEPDKLVLDQFASELVLGRHLEAVLSEHPFAAPT